MDTYDKILLHIVSKYDNQGDRPRISIHIIERQLWSKVEEEQFGKIPYVEKLQGLKEHGFIATSYDPGSYQGYYITEKGKQYLSDK